MNHLKHIQPIVIDVTPEWEGERGDGGRGDWEKKFLARPRYSLSVLLPCLYSSLLMTVTLLHTVPTDYKLPE
ncbi:MAG: hypothetical protein PUP93_04365 [Rhizonema sp. NSF051]|nr:hypothetical protein [Rhizonema sp. NSF051]